MQVDTDHTFLSPANESFDFRSLIRRSAPSKKSNTVSTVLPFTFRETLVSPVPFAKNERLPASYALGDSESAFKLAPQPNYVYSKRLDLYVLARHSSLEILIQQELLDLTTEKISHGSQSGFQAGCRGPLCRRARRIERADTELLRRTRLIFAETGTVYQPTGTRYSRLKQSVPQYAAVEPLMTAYTVLAYRTRPPVQPTKAESQYLIPDGKSHLVDLLGEHFGPDAFGNGQVGHMGTYGV